MLADFHALLPQRQKLQLLYLLVPLDQFLIHLESNVVHQLVERVVDMVVIFALVEQLLVALVRLQHRAKLMFYHV